VILVLYNTAGKFLSQLACQHACVCVYVCVCSKVVGCRPSNQKVPGSIPGYADFFEQEALLTLFQFIQLYGTGVNCRTAVTSMDIWYKLE